MKQLKNKENIRHRILSVIALVGLFACGLMIGLAIPKYNNVKDNKLPVVTVKYIEKPVAVDNIKPTCEKIRDEMLGLIHEQYGHIYNAKIYAGIAANGCESESEYYKNLAEQELAVERAVTDANLGDQNKTEVVEAYKKIQMQAAAEEIFEKAKKLTNPAIDFILEVEKIINE